MNYTVLLSVESPFSLLMELENPTKKTIEFYNYFAVGYCATHNTI
jgi:hypothetical protein